MRHHKEMYSVSLPLRRDTKKRTERTESEFVNFKEHRKRFLGNDSWAP
jgi:hypothetical protein